jgi:hypothetical protein
MSEILDTLMRRLNATQELLRLSSPSLYGGEATNQRVMDALFHIKQELLDNGEVDLLRVAQVFASTGALQEIALENDWGIQFVHISREVDRILDELKGFEKVH